MSENIYANQIDGSTISAPTPARDDSIQSTIGVELQSQNEITIEGDLRSASDISGTVSNRAAMLGEVFLGGSGGGGTSDYNDLTNIPTINTVLVKGDKTSSDYHIIRTGTTAYWNSQPTYIPMQGELVVYTDYAQTTENGQTIYYENFKIGDGNAYLIDKPFVGDDLRIQIMRHITDADNQANPRHVQASSMPGVTTGERGFWNAKVRPEVTGEELFLTDN